MQRITSTRRSFSAGSHGPANRQPEVQVDTRVHRARPSGHARSRTISSPRPGRRRRTRHPSSVAVVSACCAAAVAGSVVFTMAAGAENSASRQHPRVDRFVLNDVALVNSLVPVSTRDGMARDPQGRAMSTALSINTQVAAAQQAEAERASAAATATATANALAASARSAKDAVWDRLAQCETGGRWNMRGARFSGGLGFYNGTWDSFGGREFASNAGLASRDQQIVVAERVRARFGYTGWGCAPNVGL
jgi:hypothetical protein